MAWPDWPRPLIFATYQRHWYRPSWVTTWVHTILGLAQYTRPSCMLSNSLSEWGSNWTRQLDRLNAQWKRKPNETPDTMLNDRMTYPSVNYRRMCCGSAYVVNVAMVTWRQDSRIARCSGCWPWCPAARSLQSGTRNSAACQRLADLIKSASSGCSPPPTPGRRCRHGTRLREPTAAYAQPPHHQRLPEQPSAAATATQILGRAVHAADDRSSAPARSGLRRSAVYIARRRSIRQAEAARLVVDQRAEPIASVRRWRQQVQTGVERQRSKSGALQFVLRVVGCRRWVQGG